MLVLVTSGSVLVHLERVHQRSSEWGWSPPAAAEKIQHLGRDYRRSTAAAPSVPSAGIRLGTTEGGGRIFGTPRGAAVPTVLHVVVGQDTYRYALVGGP